MTQPAKSPAVYTIPPGVPFLRTLARGLLERFGTDDPLELARVTVFLPTRRAVRGLRDELWNQAAAAGHEALLMPEVCALGDVDEDELVLTLPGGMAGAEDFDLPPAVDEITRQVLLAQLIERWSEDRHRAGDAVPTLGPAQSISLAAALSDLLDHLHTEDATLNSLADLVPSQFSEHWQVTVEFLSILSRHWPEILRGEGALDPGERRIRLLRALARRWRKAPPDHPVFAAGSTGSIPATAELLEVIAHLPRGNVLLPGLDTHLDERSWDALDPPHPQFGLKILLERFGTSRTNIEVWDGVPPACATPAQTSRAALWSAALRPAAATTEWPALAARTATLEAFSGLYRIDADDSAQEAGIIACLLRQTLETPERTAALVTPDRDLARRVAAELRRWQIDIDDSAGQPLAGTRLGIFLRSLLEAVETRFAPVALLSLLKHDLSGLGMNPEEKRAAVSALERAMLRGLKPVPGLAALKSGLDRLSEAGRKGLGSARMLIERLEEATTSLCRQAETGTAPLRDLARSHLEAAEAVAQVPGGVPLWEGEDGEAAGTLFDELTAQDDNSPWPLSEYALAFTGWLRSRPVHARRPGHPRLFIWGPLEARLQYADVMILGGLNEGSWPSAPKPDPWLNRAMRDRLGLPDAERRIGQAAHDLMQLACAPEVYLTRSAKSEGAPQLPSRWLLRLEALLKAAERQPDSLAPPQPVAAIFRQIDRHGARQRIDDPRPTPPVDARPERLPVTAIETLVRDPYAVYARYVLGLRALEPLEAEPGPGERGTFIHDTLRRFTARFADGLPADKSAALTALSGDALAALKKAIGPEWLHPSTYAFWRARFEAAAEWFVEWEYERRASGAAPVLWEAKGEMSLEERQGFTLTARADRIDRLATGGYAVLDYKSGRAPTDKEVAAGFAPQLPLEAAILEAGGFEDAVAGPAAELLYVMLGGGRMPGEERVITGGAGSANACVAAALEGLKSLIGQYQNLKTPFLSRPHIQFLAYRSEYDHLARVKEWSAGGEESGE